LEFRSNQYILWLCVGSVYMYLICWYFSSKDRW